METDKELTTIKDIVKSILEVNPKTRNSDKWLIIETLRAMGFKIYIDYKDLEACPSFETIRRTRQKLQEENPNLSADEEIQEQRDNRRNEFKEYFKPSNPNRPILEANNYLKPRGTVEVINFTREKVRGTEVFERNV